jgi:pimeloyl-ACP methyl ester carboxylesterase
MASRLCSTAFHIAVSFLAAGAASAAERAAGIEYDFVNRPPGLATDFEAPPNAALRFLAIKAMDGFRVDATLVEPRSSAPARTTLIISIHGSGGRYDEGPPAILARRLPATGYAVLAINTRQSGSKINTDNFLEIRRDIEAAVYTARALGYQAIVLHGHSIGNIQVQYYAANNWDPDIKAVVLTGAFANVPWKSRHMLIQNEETFAKLHDAALNSLREGTEGNILPLRMRRTPEELEPVNGRHFLTYRVEETSTADGTYWIRRIPRPILMVRDDGDMTIQAFEPYMLLSAARASGSLVPSIKFVLLPNPKGPNPGGHGFDDNRQQLVDTIVAWLHDQKL